MRWFVFFCLSVFSLLVILPQRAAAQDEPPRTSPEIVEAAPAEAWRLLDPANTLYLTLPTGDVVIELAPRFAPKHAENIKAMVQQGFFDDGAVIRSQDNYVAQWATRSLPEDAEPPALLTTSLDAEIEVAAANQPFMALPDADVYAPEAGFVDGFAAGRDADTDVMWMAHCYGVVGVARSTDLNSGNGSQLYMVTGHAPRHLDRNITVVGRVVEGAEHLSTLPRGTGRLGFYETSEERTSITARVGSDVPEEERLQLEIMRTDSDAFREHIMARRSRTEAFFVRPADRIDVCNVPVPTRLLGE
ncbi:MAG: peptidylprolyl isomerase [Rhodothermales bacterium]